MGNRLGNAVEVAKVYGKQVDYVGLLEISMLTGCSEYLR
jgi:hypothetical protein